MNVKFQMRKDGQTKWVKQGEIQKYLNMGWEKVLNPDGTHVCSPC